jgi:hypothetical protein
MIQTPTGEIESPFHDAKLIGVNFDNAAYVQENVKRGDASFVASRSMLMEFAHNPHRWRAGYTRKETSALNLGSLMDCLTLQPETFDARYAVQPRNYRDEKSGEEKKWNGNANFCKAWKAEQEGRLICKQADREGAEEARQKLRQDELVEELLTISMCQVCIHATYLDHATKLEIPVKVMLDGLPSVEHCFFGKCLWDFKSARSVENTKWMYAVDSYHYDAQAALELDVYATLKPSENRTAFLHIGQESFAPFEVGRKWLNMEFVDLGRNKYFYALAKYCRCLRDNNWPGMDDEQHDSIQGWTVIKPTLGMVERAKQAIPAISDPPPEREEQEESIP